MPPAKSDPGAPLLTEKEQRLAALMLICMEDNPKVGGYFLELSDASLTKFPGRLQEVGPTGRVHRRQRQDACWYPQEKIERFSWQPIGYQSSCGCRGETKDEGHWNARRR